MERAYNPQTGEYVFLVNNQWVKPTQSAKNPQTGESAFLVGGQWQVVPSQAPKVPSKERTWGEAVTDPLVSAAGGIGSLIKLPGQLYGLATGDFSPTGALGFGQSVEDYWKAKKSEGLLAREAERKAKIQEAEKQGQIQAGKTAFLETVKDPALLTSFLGENIPQLIPGLAAARGVKAATGLAGLGPAAQTTAAVGAAKGVGAVQQGADVGAESYGEIYKTLIKQGASPDEAKAKAINLARASGASAAVISVLANSLPGGSAIERAMAGVPGKGGRLMGAVKGGLGEGFVSEPAEEVGGKFGANLALREVAPGTPLTRGLGETAGMAAVGGLGMGALSGALRTPGTTAPPPPAPVPPAERVEPTLGAQPSAAPAPEAKPAGYQELFDKYRGMRMSAENADTLARQTLAEQAAQQNPNAVMVAKWNEPMLRATLEQQLEKPEKATRTEMPDGTVKILQQNQPLVTAIREELARRGLPEKTGEQVAAEDFQKRVVELTQEYIGAGVPPQDAAIRAMEQAQTETQADETAQKDQEGAPDDAKPVEPAVGEGVQVAGEPSAGAPAPGVGEPPAGGVVPTEPDAGRLDAGTAGQPSAVVKPDYANMTLGELQSAKENADATNLALDVAAIKKHVSPEAASAYEGMNTRQRNKWWDENATENLDKDASTFNGVNEETIDEYINAYNAFDTTSPEALGKSVALNVRKIKDPNFVGSPEYLTLKNALAYAKEKGWSEKDVLDAMRGRATEWAGSDAKELFGDLFTAKKAAPSVQQTQPPELPALEAPVTPPTKRGRKPLAPEQKAASDERRAEQRKQANAAAREVEQLGRALDEALKPLDETQFGDEQSLADAKADKQREKVKAIRDLYDFSRANRNTPGARATELLKNPAVTPKERADIESGYRLRQKAKGKIQPAQIGESAAPAKAESAFRGFTNATQALSHIAKTGSAFQKFLANRLRSSTIGVKFVVVEKGDPTPEGLSKGEAAKAWDRARGLFVRDDATGARTVYVRGESFGADQGVNNVTVLHEILHAATVQKLYLGLKADQQGFSQDAQVTKATRELIRIMRAAQDEFLRLNRRGAVPKGVAAIYEATDGEVFGDPREFLAYGMSDPDIQNFLNGIEDVAAAETFFSRFVDAIRDFFGIGEDQHTAMTNLVNVTDKLLKARVAGDLKFLEKTEQKDAQKAEAGAQKVSAERKKKMSAAERKIARSRSAQEIVDGIGVLTTLRDPKLLMDALGSSAETLKIANLKALLPALQTNIIAEWGEKLGIKGLAETWRGVQDMSAMRNNIMISASEISQDWLKLQPGVAGRLLKGKKNEITALADVMHYSTDRQIDPTKSTKDPVLNNMWNDLSPQAKKVYEEVRDFYKAQYDLYRALLDKRIAEMNIPGDISDPDTAKGRLMADIKKLYESGSKIEPYFPLMRYGDYWLRVGKGKGSEFYMFESPYQREMFLKQRQRTWEAEGKTPDIEKGNSLGGLRSASIQNNDGTLLKQIFETLDEPGATKDLEALKDQIYQLYLTTMPEQSFRKQFIHRKGTAGFSGDALRNFVTSSVNMANQLSRLQYGPRLMQSIKRADGSLEEMPNKDKLEMLVREMQIRVEMDVYPEVTNPFLNTAANIANKSAFLYFMTSVKTAVSQLASLPVFGFPVLASRHNPAAVVKEMSRFMLLFNEFGVTKKNADGSTSFVAPTVAESRLLTEEEKRAVEEMTERGLAEVTMTYDLMDRKQTPTTKYAGAWQATTNAMGALFHHTERINREVMFLTSFRLSRGEGKSFEDSIEQAVSDTYAALGNFTAQNRPRVMRSPVGRVLLQFKTFPAFVSTYMIRNLYRMTRDMDPAARKEARIQFFGTLGMSYALAGYVGVPGVSFAFGVAQSIINAMKDEDDEDPIEMRDIELYFRTVYLKNLFGDFKIGDKKLGEILEAGLLNSLTGYDLSSSLNMNNMWFPDLKESATYAQGVLETAMAFIGPFGSLVGKQFPAAIDDFQAGRTMRGFEKLLPNLFRQPVTAARYAEEGATTTTGAPIRDPEEFTKGQLAMQALGFRTEGLAKTQEMNFKVEALRQKVLQDRGKLINRLDTELTQGDEIAADNVMEKILIFNSRNPSMQIEADMLNKALLARAKARMTSDRGFKVDEKLYPYLVELLDPSRELLEREAAK
jgi:hypothetical protein